MSELDDVDPGEVSFSDDPSDAAPDANPEAEVQVDEDRNAGADSNDPLTDDDPNKAW